MLKTHRTQGLQTQLKITINPYFPQEKTFSQHPSETQMRLTVSLKDIKEYKGVLLHQEICY